MKELGKVFKKKVEHYLPLKNLCGFCSLKGSKDESSSVALPLMMALLGKEREVRREQEQSHLR